MLLIKWRERNIGTAVLFPIVGFIISYLMNGIFWNSSQSIKCDKSHHSTLVLKVYKSTSCEQLQGMDSSLLEADMTAKGSSGTVNIFDNYPPTSPTDTDKFRRVKFDEKFLMKLKE